MCVSPDSRFPRPQRKMLLGYEFGGSKPVDSEKERLGSPDDQRSKASSRPSSRPSSGRASPISASAVRSLLFTFTFAVSLCNAHPVLIYRMDVFSCMDILAYIHTHICMLILIYIFRNASPIFRRKY